MENKFKLILESLYYISAIIGIIFIGYQAYIARKDFKFKIEYQKREKAVDMAKEFSEMIETAQIAVYPIQNSVYIKTFSNHENDYTKLKEFTTEEMEKIYNEKDETVLKNFSVMKLEKNKIKELYFLYYGIEEYLKLETSLSEEKLSKLKQELTVKHDSDLTNLLNKFEWFAMNFITHIADEEVVYQSLHQVYLKTVKSLYFHIASRNNNGAKDKYYCYTIELYNKWAKRYHEDLEKEENIRKKYQKEKEEIDNKHQKEKSGKTRVKSNNMC